MLVDDWFDKPAADKSDIAASLDKKPSPVQLSDLHCQGENEVPSKVIINTESYVPQTGMENNDNVPTVSYSHIARVKGSDGIDTTPYEDKKSNRLC